MTEEPKFIPLEFDRLSPEEQSERANDFYHDHESEADGSSLFLWSRFLERSSKELFTPQAPLLLGRISSLGGLCWCPIPR